MKWKNGSPLTIQLSSNVQNDIKYLVVDKLCDQFHQEEGYHLPHASYLPYLMKLSKQQHGLKCSLLYLHDLAELNLVLLPCNETLTHDLVCIKDKVNVKFTQVNRRSVAKEYFCTFNAILVNGFCYEFHTGFLDLVKNNIKWYLIISSISK